MDAELLKQISIPIFSGFIGYATNWSGVWMLFNPLGFKGFRLPGLRRSPACCHAGSSRSPA